jgi:hypothetical protein
VAIEDAILLGLCPDVSQLRKIIAETRPPPAGVSGYTRPPKRYSEMMKVSCWTIKDIPEIVDLPDVKTMLYYQRGQMEYAVAALAIWMTTPTAAYVNTELELWKIPLSKWIAHIKPFASQCRQLGQIFGRGEAEVEHAFAMRKLIALIGRSDADADWAKEVADRTTDTTPKRACGNDGIISTDAYRSMRRKTLEHIVECAKPLLVKSGGSFGEYVTERWWNTPRGTSSLAAKVKQQLKEKENPMLDLQLRPIKPVTYEVESVDDILAAAAIMPAAHARGSTKPEPGYKCRALLAVDDATAFIAGYASAKVETVTKAEGMVLRQDPADVSEWVNFDIGCNVWRVSNDYSNFNILNSLRSMQEVDLAFARMWDTVPYRYARQKAAACRWVAASHALATFTCPAGSYTAVTGLWSGHRNTARDNTMLHVCYLNSVKSVMRALYGPASYSSKQRICGDDETIAYDNWVAAVTHTHVADALGFTSQVDKGMLSLRHDEFLQLIRMPGRPPKYPVAHTILTFCSGNWYKDPVRDISSTVKDISDHLWDMVLGGVPQTVAQQLGCRVLDYLVQVKDEKNELVPLEWWKYRGCGLPEGHPLWGCDVTEASPLFLADVDVGDLPAAATDDSLAREEAAWARIDPAIRRRVRQQRATASYRNVAKNALTRQYDAMTLQTWPQRQRTVYRCDGQNNLVKVPVNRWRAIPDRTRARSARAVAIQVKFPPELLDTEEMWEAMTGLQPRERATMLAGLHERQKPTVSWRWWLPPLLRAT